MQKFLFFQTFFSLSTETSFPNFSYFSSCKRRSNCFFRFCWNHQCEMVYKISKIIRILFRYTEASVNKIKFTLTSPESNYRFQIHPFHLKVLKNFARDLHYFIANRWHEKTPTKTPNWIIDDKRKEKCYSIHFVLLYIFLCRHVVRFFSNLCPSSSLTNRQ